MLSPVGYYWLEVIAPIYFLVEVTTDPFPPGTQVLATISLSTIDTLFDGNDPDPKFAINASIASWTYYLPDGTESPPQTDSTFLNAVSIDNCARITFGLFGERALGLAQATIYST